MSTRAATPGGSWAEAGAAIATIKPAPAAAARTALTLNQLLLALTAQTLEKDAKKPLRLHRCANRVPRWSRARDAPERCVSSRAVLRWTDIGSGCSVPKDLERERGDWAARVTARPPRSRRRPHDGARDVRDATTVGSPAAHGTEFA